MFDWIRILREEGKKPECFLVFWLECLDEKKREAWNEKQIWWKDFISGSQNYFTLE